jgi:hypothetical protein
MKNNSLELWRSWVRSRQRICSGSSSTGWRDSNGFLRIIVIIVHKMNIHQFRFPHLFSVAEMLSLDHK